MRFIVTIIALLISLPTMAREPVKNDHSLARLWVSSEEVAAGKPVQTVLELELEKDWHVYWRNPGDSGMAAEIRWQLPEGFAASDVIWPTPERIMIGPLMSYGYNKKAYHKVVITPPAEVKAGQEYPVTVNATWLICHEICVPEKASFTFALRGVEGTPEEDTQASQVITKVDALIPEKLEGARFAEDKNQAMLSLPWTEKTPEKVLFFPFQDGVLENSASHMMKKQGEVLLFGFKRGTQAAPEIWEGVIAVEGRERGYQVAAVRDDALLSAAPAASRPEEAPIGLVFAVIFAFLGGIILNAMPCVFPILSLKAVAIAKKGKGERKAVRLQGIAYTAGVMMSFALLAGVMILLQHSGTQLGWGYHMQSPVFVAVMAYILLAVGLSLSGVFHLPVMFGSGNAKDGISGSFATGVLATAVATPCTAPFMAPALGYALVQPPLVSLIVFLALGFGLAFPYLLVSSAPALHRMLPKPGLWMERFKQVLAFPMYASAAWLVWVVAQQSGMDGLALVLVGCVSVGLLAWLWAVQENSSVVWRWGWRVLLLALIGWTAWVQAPMEKAAAVSTETEVFSRARLDALLSEKKPVFVHATAAWCITCKVNERVALYDAKVMAEMKAKGFVHLVADWTNQDAEITAYLKSFGRNGVPIYVVYAPGKAPVVLPQLLTPSLVMEALGK